MVIHEEGETPTEVAIIRKPLFEPKTYVIVENHVRELTNNVDSKPNVCCVQSEEKSPPTIEICTKNKCKKSSKKGKLIKLPAESSTESGENAIIKETEISKSDLDELRSVYIQCKAVVEKIEKKYGHLINSFSEGESSSSQNRKRNIEYEEYEQEDVCQCTFNKKSVFDDDGRQIYIDSNQDTHICPKKLKKSHHSTTNQNIQVEYTENEIQLSDNLQELVNILENPDTEITYRNKVIDKVKTIRQVYINEIKFNKHALMEKLKNNPDEIFDFKGTNLSSLPGYL